MFEALHDWWCWLRRKPTPHEEWRTQFEQRQREEAEQQATWLASLPADLQAELQDAPRHQIGLLMATAALTPESDRANAVRRWRTLPDQLPYLPSATLIERIDHVFRTHLRPDGTEYSYEDIATAFEGAVDPTYVAQLRSGAIADPDPQVVFQLGRFFHIQPTYFYPFVHIRYVTGPLDPSSRIAEERFIGALLGLVEKAKERGAAGAPSRSNA